MINFVILNFSEGVESNDVVHAGAGAGGREDGARHQGVPHEVSQPRHLCWYTVHKGN